MERCWPARHAAIEGDRARIARLRLDRRRITVVLYRAGAPAEDEATVTVDEYEDAAGIEPYANEFQRVAPLVPGKPLGLGFGERRAVAAGTEPEKSALLSDREGGHGRQSAGVDRVERPRPPRARNDPCRREDGEGENRENRSDQQTAHALIACSWPRCVADSDATQPPLRLGVSEHLPIGTLQT